MNVRVADSRVTNLYVDVRGEGGATIEGVVDVFSGRVSAGDGFTEDNIGHFGGWERILRVLQSDKG